MSEEIKTIDIDMSIIPRGYEFVRVGRVENEGESMFIKRAHCHHVLNNDIGSEGLIIRRKQLKYWKPNFNDRYFFINSNSVVVCNRWIGSEDDIAKYEYGNCYPTKDYANEALMSIKAAFKVHRDGLKLDDYNG